MHSKGEHVNETQKSISGNCISLPISACRSHRPISARGLHLQQIAERRARVMKANICQKFCRTLIFCITTPSVNAIHMYNVDGYKAFAFTLALRIFEGVLNNDYYGYSQGPMFVDRQNLAGSCVRNSVGNWFVASQCKTIHYFVKCLQGRKFVGKGNPRNPQTLIRHEQ